CISRPPAASARVAIEAADRREAARGAVATASSRRTMDVAFHVIRSKSKAGDVPRAQLVRQINVMNAAYKRTSFRFRLRSITRTTNGAWYKMTMDSAEETRAKDSLHSGHLSTLNVYTTGTKDALGWAVFPWEAGRKGKQDGIVMDYTTLPGGSHKPYHLGDTLVHETGHWLGLYHTFQGECADKDGVSDTPAEKSEAFGCPTKRDTCKDDPGRDPIRNFMDYTDDSCMNEFTGGQRGRLGRMTGRYRPYGVTREGGDPCGDGVCDGTENDTTCPADCGCAATESCDGVAPFGCYCDPDCAASGDCCSDAATCT
ncbi:MAG TPA: zinc metalloprotease, partial [Kofleriaceae bacterium]|nr:zinc metalloprotease [Kofleriaceae bacterium]